jgi:alpha-tubulin suppressor-like RCC1 family protein
MISAGGYHTCGIKNGELYCWGYNKYGQLGIGSIDNQYSPEKVGTDSDWTFIKAGMYTTCGIRSGELFCWGNNDQSIIGDEAMYSEPTQIGSDSDWTEVSYPYTNVCGIKNGKLFCWGHNQYGQLGDGTSGYGMNKTDPVQVGTSSLWTDISSTQFHSCGINNSKVYCWGWNNFGQLGNGEAWELTPVEVVEP